MENLLYLTLILRLGVKSHSCIIKIFQSDIMALSRAVFWRPGYGTATTTKSSIDVPEVFRHDVKHTRIVLKVSKCPSVTLVHPAKGFGRNEMPFGRDTRVVPGDIVLDRGPGPSTGRGDLGAGTPVCSDAPCHQQERAQSVPTRMQRRWITGSCCGHQDRS